jgi:hypothetical protein
LNIPSYSKRLGHAVEQLVEVLCYKPEGCGFDSRRCHWNFSSHNPSGRTVSLDLTQPLTKISTRNNSWELKATGV